MNSNLWTTPIHSSIFGFRRSPFQRKMELFSMVPLLLCLTVSWLGCTVFVHIHQLPPDDFNRLGCVVALFSIAMSVLVFFAIANIFIIIGFLHLDYPNSPKGLVSKILYRSSTIFALIWSLLVIQTFFAPDFPRLIPL